MILFEQKTSFIKRFIYNIDATIVLLLFYSLFVYYFYYEYHVVVFILLISLNALLGFWKVRLGYIKAIYWIESLRVELETNTALIKLFKKDQLILEKQIAIQNLKFVMIPIPGNPTTTYKAEIYEEGTLVGTIYQVCKMDKSKMKEIVLFFNPNDKIANKKRL